MTVIRYEGASYEARPDESVLTCLERHGISIPSACRAGACQSCMMRALDGRPPAKAQTGIRDSLRVQGYFLACVCQPEEDLEVTTNVADTEVLAEVREVERLSDTVARLRFAVERFEYRAGQFVSIVREDGLVRSYSLASVPTEDTQLEIHVREIPGGRMSHWLAREVSPGQRVVLRGPAGACLYVEGKPEQPLLLVGTGTGLAPLYGIVRDALSRGHRAPIVLVHGAVNARGLYLTETLHELARKHSNFTYVQSLLQGDAAANVEIDPVDRYLARAFPSLREHRVFLCGDPGLVLDLRKKAFLAGARFDAIHADAFLPAASTSSS